MSRDGIWMRRDTGAPRATGETVLVAKRHMAVQTLATRERPSTRNRVTVISRSAAPSCLEQERQQALGLRSWHRCFTRLGGPDAIVFLNKKI
jgi:hypothetical protein